MSGGAGPVGRRTPVRRTGVRCPTNDPNSSLPTPAEADTKIAGSIIGDRKMKRRKEERQAAFVSLKREVSSVENSPAAMPVRGLVRALRHYLEALNAEMDEITSGVSRDR